MILSVKITWIGHGSFKIETETNKIIYLDPWIEGNPVCNIKLDFIVRADIICVTHGHIDHIGDSIEIAKKTGGTLISTPEICFYAQKKGIPRDGGALCPLNIGGSCVIKGVKVIMTNAAHTSEIMISESDFTAGSGACGYVIITEGGVRIYFAGDTGVFGDMKIISDLYAPHIAIMPIGGKYNMGIREAAYAAHLMKPEILIPMHYGTFPDQEADISELKKLVNTLAPFTRVMALKPGETFEYRK